MSTGWVRSASQEPYCMESWQPVQERGVALACGSKTFARKTYYWHALSPTRGRAMLRNAPPGGPRCARALKLQKPPSQKEAKRNEPGERREAERKETAPSSLEDGRMPYKSSEISYENQIHDISWIGTEAPSRIHDISWIGSEAPSRIHDISWIGTE